MTSEPFTRNPFYFKNVTGLLISSICTEETPAIQCALASVYPNMILSGKFAQIFLSWNWNYRGYTRVQFKTAILHIQREKLKNKFSFLILQNG